MFNNNFLRRFVSLPLAIVSPLLAIGFCSCQRTHYDITMRPDGEKLHREITVWRDANSQKDGAAEEFGVLPQEELDRIAKAYGKEPLPAEAKKYRFSSEFSGATPDDVGGGGWHSYWKSPLGSASMYTEQFRGNDDLLDDVELRQQSAEQIVDLVVAWAAAELKGADGYERLHAFLDGDLRRDLKNLSLYWWRYGQDNTKQEEALLRAAHYLAARNYFSPRQVPGILRAVDEASRKNPQPLLKFIQRMIATKMGLAADQPIPAALDILAEPERMQASLAGYLKTTDLFRQQVQRWEQQRQKNPDLDPPLPERLLGELLMTAFPLVVRWNAGDELKVAIELTAQPYQTNGRWDEAKKQITWDETLISGEGNRTHQPTMLYAAWSRPNTMMQIAYFGREVLVGQKLAEYCLWYNGLSQAEAKEWDAFVANLRASRDAAERLKTFRFEDEPTADDEKDFTSQADRAVQLLVEGLKGDGGG